MHTTLFDSEVSSAVTAYITALSSSSFSYKEYYANARSAGDATEPFYWLAIGQA